MHRIQNRPRQQDQRNVADGYERPIGSHASPKQDILPPYQVARDPGASNPIIDNPNVYRGDRLYQQPTYCFPVANNRLRDYLCPLLQKIAPATPLGSKRHALELAEKMRRTVSDRATLVLGYPKGESNSRSLEIEKGPRLHNLNP